MEGKFGLLLKHISSNNNLVRIKKLIILIIISIMECIICKDEGNKECIFRLENCACSSYYCKECLSLWFKNNKKYNCIYCMKFLSIKDLKKLNIKTPSIPVNIIEEGNIEVIEKMMAEGYEVKENVIDVASQNGHLEVVKYFHEVVGAKCTVDTMYYASENGHLEVVEYLHEVIGAKCTKGVMDHVSLYGHLEVIKYLHEVVGAECTTRAMNWASYYGHLEVVKYLHEVVGAKYSEHVMSWTSRNGHLEIVKYLHEVVGAKCTKYAMDFASRYGQLEVVKYLHEVVGV